KEFVRIEEYEKLGIPEGTIVRNEGTIMYGVADVQNLTPDENIKRKELTDEVLAENGYNTLVITDGKMKTIVTNNTLATPSVEVIEVQEKLDIPFSVVDEVPIFPGCENASDKKACFQEKMNEHIGTNFTYPKEAQEKGIQGKVYVVFTIDTDGTIRKIKKRGPYPILEKEALRIISLLPKMTPGKQKGEVVAVPFSLPINFKLGTDVIDFKLMPITENMDTKIKVMAEKYNKLVVERERLLKTTSETNPIIRALDEQLIRLELTILEEQKLLEDNKDQSIISYQTADKKPIFPGCESVSDIDDCFDTKIKEHINLNFTYPKEAKEKGIQGKVYAFFVINNEGEIVGTKMHGPDPILEQEAVRIISLLPKVKPAEFRGKKVSVFYSLPISFVMNNGKNDEIIMSEKTDFMFVEAEKIRENNKTYITGKVFDKNSALPGVTITIKDTKLGAITNYDGEFKIAVEEGQVLLFQYLKIPNAVLTVTEKESYKVSTPKE
ncbi:MAG: TonB family protein, partial [Cellulophaga sp.]|nr:TonB family protein [Cellulophaga sp.]